MLHLVIFQKSDWRKEKKSWQWSQLHQASKASTVNRPYNSLTQLLSTRDQTKFPVRRPRPRLFFSVFLVVSFMLGCSNPLGRRLTHAAPVRHNEWKASVSLPSRLLHRAQAAGNDPRGLAAPTAALFSLLRFFGNDNPAWRRWWTTW